MALEISGSIELDNGLTLSSCYARTIYNVNQSSNKVNISVNYWVNKTSYDNGLQSFYPNFLLDGRYEYDRNVDGEDVLQFTQIKIKAELEALGYSVVITDI
jgi:hypothetical protein